MQVPGEASLPKDSDERHTVLVTMLHKEIDDTKSKLLSDKKEMDALRTQLESEKKEKDALQEDYDALEGDYTTLVAKAAEYDETIEQLTKTLSLIHI